MTLNERTVKSPGSCPAIGLIVALLLPVSAQCQITPAEADEIKSVLHDRIEALTIFSGDYALGGGTFQSNGSAAHSLTLDVSKFGGAGDFGEKQQLGDLNIAWRPTLMGNIGTIDAKNRFNSPLLEGDLSETKSLAVQFGGGAHFWFTDSFSLAPSLMGMYGHTTNDYTATSAFMVANLAKARQVGLVDWSADTWTIRPSLNVQYVYAWDRTLITFSSDSTYLHTESFKSSNSNLGIEGDSEVWDSKIDVDVPLGRLLFGHELRTGGYFERSELYGDLKEGLNTAYVNDIHGRLVLDFLNQLWLTQWIGIGASYYWGSNFTGWSVGLDFMFVF
jgi:hypothetical protein